MSLSLPDETYNTLCTVTGSAPHDCQAIALSSTSIRTSWAAPTTNNRPIRFYTVSYRPLQSLSGQNLSSTLSITTGTLDNSTQLVLSQLLKGTSYSITLTANTVMGPSPASTDQCITYTLEDGELVYSITVCIMNYYTNVAPDGPPLTISVIAATFSSITVSWSPPDLALQNGAITSYRLLYTADPLQHENKRLSDVTNATTLSYQLTNLQSNTSYYISISASTSIGFGPYANTSTATTSLSCELTATEYF